MNISETIFNLINRRGMSQKEFARRTGIPQSTVSDWKGKKLNPSADKILIICDVLDVTPYELLGGTEGGKYKLPEHIFVQKNTEEFLLIEKFRKLEESRKTRLIGYLDALHDLQEKEEES